MGSGKNEKEIFEKPFIALLRDFLAFSEISKKISKKDLTMHPPFAYKKGVSFGYWILYTK